LSATKTAIKIGGSTLHYYIIVIIIIITYNTKPYDFSEYTMEFES